MSQTYRLLVLGKSLPDALCDLFKQHLSVLAVQFTSSKKLPVYAPAVQTSALVFSLDTQLDKCEFAAHIDAFAAKYQLDILILPHTFEPPKLAVFDMDSTLIATEVIDELAQQAGIGAQVKIITERAMLGELDFNQSFIQRMALLKGLDIQVLQEIRENLPLMDGALALFAKLKEQGCYSAILSGGFGYFATYLQDLLGINEAHANVLDSHNQKLTGLVKAPIINAQAKADILKKLTDKLRLTPVQTMAVGDGANDLLMLAEAGMGVAFHAKPTVQMQAQFKLNYNGLDALGYLYADS